jgi:hypothetical protein
LTEALLRTGKHNVTAITRVGSTHKLPEGCHVARVDYNGDDLTALVETLRGQQALIITMAVTAPRDTVSKLIRAAALAGVPHVMPNWFGHDVANRKLCEDSMLTLMGDAVSAEIKALGVSWYLQLVYNFWYEFSLGGGPDRFGFDFQKRSLILFDNGNVPINVSTWPQCARAVASLFSLKGMPDDVSDTSTTLLQFCNRPVYISSFRLSQFDMFESVKRVTRTSTADWTITHKAAQQRWKHSFAEVVQGNFGAFTKMLYSRMFFLNGGGDYESHVTLDNSALGLPSEELDEHTAIAVRIGELSEVEHSHR